MLRLKYLAVLIKTKVAIIPSIPAPYLHESEYLISYLVLFDNLEAFYFQTFYTLQRRKPFDYIAIVFQDYL